MSLCKNGISKMNISELWRFPVKGLRGEPLKEVAITTNAPFPLDRRFALAHGKSGITYESPKWALKTEFHMLMHNSDERLAELTPHFDETRRLLTTLRDGVEEARTFVDDPDGHVEINRYFERLLGKTNSTIEPQFVQALDFQFGNIEEPVVSLINLASVRQLSETVGKHIDVARFRGNIIIDGASPWEERDWVNRTVTINDATFMVVDETIRCGATVVNPDTCERDLNIPKLLQQNYGHMFCGVYLIAKQEGTISPDASLFVSN